MTEGPWKLPRAWRWTTLGAACDINPRRPPLRLLPDAPTSFVPMSAVHEAAGTLSNTEMRPYRHVRTGYTFFHEGDVLFAKITPSMQNGKAAIARGLRAGIGFGSTEFHVLHPKTQVCPEWPFFFVRRELFRKEAESTFTGTVGQKRVPEDFLHTYPLPLPPLPEQRRIVAKIEALFQRIREAKRLRTEAQKDAGTLLQSAMEQVFPHPGAPLPPGWRWVKLGEILSLIRNGLTKKQNKENRGIPVTRIATISHGFVDPSWAGYVEGLSDKHIEEFRLRSGDILFSHINSDPLLGNCALYEGAPPLILHGMNLLLMRTDPAKCAPRYLQVVFRHSRHRGIFTQIAARAIGQSSINQRNLKLLDVPLPPLPEQRRIVAHLDSLAQRVKQLKRAQEETEAELKRLEQSILDRAFRGDL